jgi:hypothetical protein
MYFSPRLVLKKQYAAELTKKSLIFRMVKPNEDKRLKENRKSCSGIAYMSIEEVKGGS